MREERTFELVKCENATQMRIMQSKSMKQHSIDDHLQPAETRTPSASRHTNDEARQQRGIARRTNTCNLILTMLTDLDLFLLLDLWEGIVTVHGKSKK